MSEYWLVFPLTFGIAYLAIHIYSAMRARYYDELFRYWRAEHDKWASRNPDFKAYLEEHRKRNPNSLL